MGLRSLNVWACKIEVELWIGSVMIGSYLLAYLTIERTFAVCVPLVSKRFLTDRMSVYVPAAAIVVIISVHIPMILILEGLIQSASSPYLCTITNTNQLAFTFWIWYGCTTLFTAHPIIMCVCSVLISSQLLLHSRRMGRLPSVLSQASAPDSKDSSSSTSSAKELQASVTVLTLAMLQCVVYFPAAIGCMFYCFAVSTPGLPTSAPVYYAQVVLFYKLSHILFTAGHVWNFYVYFLKIPSFRRKLLHSIFCKIFSTKNTTVLSTSRTFNN